MNTDRNSMQSDPSCYSIGDTRLFGTVKKQISLLWGINQKLSRFPGSQPRPLCRSDICNMHKYVVTEKTDGERYSLLLTKLDNKCTAVLVNRKFSMFQIKVIAPTVYFDGTLLEGELVMEDDFLKFLVFDITALSGKSVHQMHFFKRYETTGSVYTG